jgi:hypothetical protein
MNLETNYYDYNNKVLNFVNKLKTNTMTTNDEVDMPTQDISTPVPGTFQQSLQRSNKNIRNDRAVGIAEDAQLTYQRRVQDLEMEEKRKLRERQNMLDMSPENAQSLILGKDFDSKKFVDMDINIGIQLRNLQIELDIARARYAELFGA